MMVLSTPARTRCKISRAMKAFRLTPETAGCKITVMNTVFRAAMAVCLGFIAVVPMAFGADNAGAISLINGKDLTGWKFIGKGTSQWIYGQAAMDPAHPAKVCVVGPGSDLISTNRTVNLSSEAVFGDCHVELEFLTGKATPGNDVDSNSGIKMMNIYEVQIFDSYGVANPSKIDCGAIYSETAPLVNACKPPGEWQKLVIDFHAPRFDAAGNKTANAKFVKVTLNGQVIQDNVEIAHGTNVSRNAKEHPTGPIYLQGDHGSVAFRNLTVTPLE
jgi:acetyltransferase-like isoleucine patch superfamily enzyme